VFLFRKLFLIKKSFSHYSQFAEDVSIVRFFPKNYRGFFVDVGCFHPVKYNNTYRLYKKGWRGVNIDLDSIKIEGFEIVRSQDVNLARAVSNRKGELSYWSNGFYSLTGTLDANFAEGKAGYIEKKVPADTLTNILDQTKFAGQKIDFLTVDAEGHDFEILSSLDFQKYQPQLIAAECLDVSLEKVLESKIYKFLKAQGYEMVNWVGITLLFKRSESRDLGV
jgi:hypothetical protein